MISDIVGRYEDTAGHQHGYLKDGGGDYSPINIPGAVNTGRSVLIKIEL